MDREAHIISQAHAAVNEARTQSAQVQQQAQDHVRNFEIQAQVSVEGANARALAVESRAHDLLTELQNFRLGIKMKLSNRRTSLTSLSKNPNSKSRMSEMKINGC